MSKNMTITLKTDTGCRDFTFDPEYYAFEELKETLHELYRRNMILNCTEYCVIHDLITKPATKEFDKYTILELVIDELNRKIHYSRISQKWHNNKRRHIA